MVETDLAQLGKFNQVDELEAGTNIFQIHFAVHVKSQPMENAMSVWTHVDIVYNVSPVKVILESCVWLPSGISNMTAWKF